MSYERWRFEIAFSSDPDSANPVWTDVTPYVDTINTPIEYVVGATSETGSEPSSAVVTLNNRDGRFTPGNASSPYYPYVRPARRCRLWELVGQQVLLPVYGWVEFPEVQQWAQADASAPRDQLVTVSIVDRLTRLSRARKFISTLGEYIRYTVPPVGYWPLGGQPPFYNAADDAPLLVSVQSAPSLSYPSYTPASGVIAPADDLATGEWADSRPVNLYSTSLSASATGTNLQQARIVFGAWVKPVQHTAATGAARVVKLATSEAGAGAGIWSLYIDYTSTVPAWHASIDSGAYATVDVQGPAVSWDTPTLVMMSVRWTRLGAPTVELWVNGKQTSGIGLSASVSTISVTGIDAPSSDFWAGSMGHVQLYTASNDAPGFDYADYQAQLEHGQLGLYNQTAGERITTLALYAGVPADQLDVDSGTALLENPSLARQAPYDGMVIAATSEQGQLRTDGAGRLVFRDRRRRYV